MARIPRQLKLLAALACVTLLSGCTLLGIGVTPDYSGIVVADRTYAFRHESVEYLAIIEAQNEGFAIAVIHPMSGREYLLKIEKGSSPFEERGRLDSAEVRSLLFVAAVVSTPANAVAINCSDGRCRFSNKEYRAEVFCEPQPQGAALSLGQSQLLVTDFDCQSNTGKN